MAHDLPLEARWTKKIPAPLARSLLGAAIVLTMLLPKASTRAAGVPPHKAMDLVWSEVDANGSPLNRDWSGQAGHIHGTGGQPDIDSSVACNYFRNGGGRLRVEMCTTQSVQVDERRPFRGPLPDALGYACRFAI